MPLIPPEMAESAPLLPFTVHGDRGPPAQLVHFSPVCTMYKKTELDHQISAGTLYTVPKDGRVGAAPGGRVPLKPLGGATSVMPS